MEQIAEEMEREAMLLQQIIECVKALKDTRERKAALVRENQKEGRVINLHGCTVNIGSYQEGA
jgi:hypothetical protein